jgi:hypothetical protein
MKFKRLLFSISAALFFLLSPSSSFAGWGGGWHGGGGWGWHGGGGWHGGWHGGGWWHGGWWHGGHWYRWGWWPGYGWGWWGWGGWYPYWAWGEYPYGYWNGGYGAYGDPGGYAGGYGEPPGAQGETSAIQSRLANLGFYHGAIDGKVGPGTESALKAFQAQHGLRASGQIDDETLSALGLGQGR